MDMTTAAVASAAGRAFSVWMPLDSFAPSTFAAAATAAGPSAVRSIVCAALSPRDGRTSSPAFYAVIASLLRRTLLTGSFGATGLHAVSLPDAEENTEAMIQSLMTCLQSLDCDTQQREDPLVEFAAEYFVDVDAVLAQTCAVLRRHRHTLRRLKVPTLRQDGAPSFADALAECTAITSLDFFGMTFPFRSWQQLGPTLHTLNLTDVGGDDTDTTFRLLADNMPALRELQLYVFGEPSQDGFIELVSRLRSLTLYANGSPWDSVKNASAWPLTLPSLRELLWWSGDGVDAVAVAVLRRGVSLRAIHVSHASALAAIASGPVGMHAPLSNVRALTLAAVANDPVSLATTLAASPRASAIKLRWRNSAPGLWDLLHAVASAASGEEAAGRRRVRRVRLDVDEVDELLTAPEPEAAARCLRALFPHARYASWGANGLPDVQLLPQSD
jgi:hypothetical protein